eukprot:CAMPEP_0117482830 /NCGR_PEP_ID=MMETSP0784-20121206/13620_1 /TAXON_ID=39447 /ORGANISM="" /LENGTH=707 /DNA_ID=CAMNT_0005277335 /DNA_START=11 /DNA_END=2132 /DNA_ORIENTATION=-
MAARRLLFTTLIAPRLASAFQPLVALQTNASLSRAAADVQEFGHEGATHALSLQGTRPAAVEVGESFPMAFNWQNIYERVARFRAFLSVESETLTSMVARGLGILMILRVAIKTLDKQFGAAPVTTLLGSVALMFMFCFTVLSFLLGVDDYAVSAIGRLGILSSLFACTNLLLTPFLLLVPNGEFARKTTKGWFRGRSGKKIHRTLFACAYMLLFFVKLCSAVSIFLIFDAQTVLHDRLVNLSHKTGFGDEAPVASMMPYVITVLYVIIAQCSKYIIFERVVHYDYADDIASEMWGWVASFYQARFEEAFQPPRIEAALNEMFKQCKEATIRGVGKLMSGIGDVGATAACSMRSILSSTMCKALLFEASLKSKVSLARAMEHKALHGRLRKKIRDDIKNFVQPVLDCGVRQVTGLQSDMADVDGYIEAQVKQFLPEFEKELSNMIVDVCCRLPSSFITEDMEKDWREVQALSGTDEEELQRRCEALVAEVMSALSSDVTRNASDAVKELISEEFDEAYAAATKQFKAMLVKLEKAREDKFANPRMLWAWVVKTQNEIKEGETKFPRGNDTFFQAVLFLDSLFERLPHRAQLLHWYAYQLLWLAAFACLARVSMRVYRVVGICPESCLFGVIMMLVLVTGVNSAWLAVTGHLYDVDDEDEVAASSEAEKSCAGGASSKAVKSCAAADQTRLQDVVEKDEVAASPKAEK